MPRVTASAAPADDVDPRPMTGRSSYFGQVPTKGFTVSSISSVSGNDQGLFQFFHQISAKTSTSTDTTAATSSSAPIQAASAATSTDATSDAQQVQDASGHHHHHDGHGGLFKKVESAVTNALAAAKSNPSADPNKVVEDAIAKVFKDNGVTPPVGGGAAHVSDGDGDAKGGPAGDVSAARQAFAQTLQSFGVSQDQFHNDFLAAVKDVQGGGASDSSDVFKSFPPGSSVDTTA